MNMKCLGLFSGVRGVLVCALVCMVVPVFGQDVASVPVAAPVSSAAPDIAPSADYTPSTLLARYPAQSITSLEQASNAIADVKKGKQGIEAIFKADEKACYKTFFANKCIRDAKERRRLALAEIRPIELEAQRFKRHEAASKREAALEEKRLKGAGVASDRTPEQKRADNEAAFKKKQEDREAVRQKVIEKRARTERRRQKKAAQAAKRAKAIKANASSASSAGASSLEASATAASTPVPTSAATSPAAAPASGK
ncbi:MAG: hypothetical protein C4516_07680 [Oxalobacter sp.]|nr:MAG: hypothetical protein C4516_07680 [Oxalobacter sp.]